MSDPFEIERFLIPGMPWQYRVKADGPYGPKFATRAEAEDRVKQLRGKR